MTKKLDLDDIMLCPAKRSYIDSRSHCKTDKSYLMTAPMDSVVPDITEDDYIDYLDIDNDFYIENGIQIVLPRFNENDLKTFEHKFFEIYNKILKDTIVSLSLNQFIIMTNINNYGSYSYEANEILLKKNMTILIDIANGHMNKLFQAVENVVNNDSYNTKIIVGNVANPETYREWCNVGVYGVRLNIGTGAGCLTSQNVAVGYPTASLISECYQISLEYDNPPLIIADGGMKDYADIIKALNLGADKVMLGSILSQMKESCGRRYLFKFLPVNKRFWSLFDYLNIPLWKKYRGMSTKEVQKKWNKKKLKTAEGTTRWKKVDRSVYKWKENLDDYLRSCMSYTDNSSLDRFIGSNDGIEITNSFRNRFKK